jgi:hypothetical protein
MNINQLRTFFLSIIIICVAFFGLSALQIIKKTTPESIADAVMQAQGGSENWDKTHVVGWHFLGYRTLVWDKWSGDVRIDFLRRDLKIIVNLNTEKGRVWLDGKETTNADSLLKYLDKGRKVWINDAYWVFMPFKLRDPGVKLKLLEAAPTIDKRAADVLELTFEKVGVTPENKYHVWVDKESRLVTQWAFFEKFSDEKPAFTNQWLDYQAYGNVKLSGDRGGEGGKLTPIRVWNDVPTGVFSDFSLKIETLF